jgi:hypothetical protein
MSVDLPGIAPVPLTSGNVRFAPANIVASGRDDPACNGTVTAPTAPAGKVCIYLGSSDKIANIQGFTSFLPTRAFAIVWNPVSSTAPSKTPFFIATWAYTAP